MGVSGAGLSRASHLSLVTEPANRSVNDAEVARGLIAGDARMEAEAWNRLAPMVYRFLRRAVGPVPEIEDLTQEVFLRLYANVGKLETPSALRSFVFSIAVRVLREELRNRKLRRWMLFTDTGTLPESEGSPLDPEARQALRRFYQVLDRMGSLERTLFVLRQVEGMGLVEMAETLDMSLATVKRHLARTTEHLERVVARDPALSAYAGRSEGGRA
jgi:RNA polymerase sigma-70 factor (ECF subfamily)